MRKITLLLLCFLTSCGLWKSNNNTKPSKPLVIVSASPYIEIVKQLAGDRVFVRSIIPPDVDPHNFEPSPRDMGPLIHASLWIQVGEEFEYLLENRLNETNPSMEILNLPKITKTLHSSCSHSHHKHCHDVDTHYWLDPITVIDQAQAIKNMLSKINPKYKKEFQKKFISLSKKLNQLNTKLKKDLSKYKGSAFLTTHNAYGYFCYRYNLIQIGIEPEEGGCCKEIRSRDIQYVLETAYAHKDDLICVLTQPQHVNRAAETIGEKLDLPLVMVNPYEEDYIATIKKLANVVKKYGEN